MIFSSMRIYEVFELHFDQMSSKNVRYEEKRNKKIDKLYNSLNIGNKILFEWKKNWNIKITSDDVLCLE